MTAAPPEKSWRPSASPDALRRRAERLAAIRGFFANRRIMEVETPALASAGVTDVHVHSLREAHSYRWLQTSPEYAMKRLLAAGLGDCYQIARVFRADEVGRLHNPEFTLLEWYRLGFGVHRLMDEVEALVNLILGEAPTARKRYRDAFLEAGLPDPLRAPDEVLRGAVDRCVDGGLPADLTRDDHLDLLLDAVVVPRLPRRCFLAGYPASQAVLARLDPAEPDTAERFELFCDGVELANGFHECQDPAALRQRFQADLQSRAAQGAEQPAMDERLLAAMEAGLPACAGVALGVDRLFMLAEGADSLAAVMAFPWDEA